MTLLLESAASSVDAFKFDEEALLFTPIVPTVFCTPGESLLELIVMSVGSISQLPVDPLAAFVVTLVELATFT